MLISHLLITSTTNDLKDIFPNQNNIKETIFGALTIEDAKEVFPETFGKVKIYQDSTLLYKYFIQTPETVEEYFSNKEIDKNEFLDKFLPSFSEKAELFEEITKKFISKEKIDSVLDYISTLLNQSNNKAKAIQDFGYNLEIIRLGFENPNGENYLIDILKNFIDEMHYAYNDTETLLSTLNETAHYALAIFSLMPTSNIEKAIEKDAKLLRILGYQDNILEGYKNIENLKEKGNLIMSSFRSSTPSCAISSSVSSTQYCASSTNQDFECSEDFSDQSTLSQRREFRGTIWNGPQKDLPLVNPHLYVKTAKQAGVDETKFKNTYSAGISNKKEKIKTITGAASSKYYNIGNKDGDTIFLTVAKQGFKPGDPSFDFCVEKCREGTMNVNIVDPEGYAKGMNVAALFAEDGNYEGLEAVLEIGANINSFDAKGRSAIAFSAESIANSGARSIDCYDLLVKNGAILCTSEIADDGFPTPVKIETKSANGKKLTLLQRIVLFKGLFDPNTARKEIIAMCELQPQTALLFEHKTRELSKALDRLLKDPEEIHIVAAILDLMKEGGKVITEGQYDKDTGQILSYVSNGQFKELEYQNLQSGTILMKAAKALKEDQAQYFQQIVDMVTSINQHLADKAQGTNLSTPDYINLINLHNKGDSVFHYLARNTNGAKTQEIFCEILVKAGARNIPNKDGLSAFDPKSRMDSGVAAVLLKKFEFNNM